MPTADSNNVARSGKILRETDFVIEESKSNDTRYIDLNEHDQLDKAQLAARVKQASQLPGEQL